MRMWMVPFELMCDKHLRGEHVEAHMFVGSIKKHINLSGFIQDGLFDPEFLFSRHDDVAAEMVRRGGKHKSPLELPSVSMWQKFLKGVTDVPCIDVEANGLELARRCPDCYDLHVKARGSLNFPRGGDKVYSVGTDWYVQFSGLDIDENPFTTRDRALTALEKKRRALTLLRQGRI